MLEPAIFRRARFIYCLESNAPFQMPFHFAIQCTLINDHGAFTAV